MTEESQTMKRCFDRSSLVSYKRHKNLRDMLVRAKLPPKRGPCRAINGLKSCGEVCRLCAFCQHGLTKKHTCKHTGKSFEIRAPMNCKTSGVVYGITCTKCPDFVYIGETGRPVKPRFSEHYRDATNNDVTKPCWKHFNLPGHSENDMTLIALEHVLPKDDILLRK